MNVGSTDAPVPAFSVVIASYNQPGLVLEAIESALRQTLSPCEVIVVDDGSTDGTPSEIERRFPQVRLVRQANCGRSIAKNTAAVHATGDWLCFLDQDDLWHPTRLARVAEFLLAHPECAALRHPVWFFSDGGPDTERGFGFDRDFVADDLESCMRAISKTDGAGNDFSYLDIAGSSYEQLLGRMIGFTSATVISRETFFRAGGFVPSIDCADDWLLYLTIARLTEWELISDRLAFVRLHAGQSTSTMSGVALADLASKIAVWYGSRPLPEHTGGLDYLKKRTTYRYLYRQQLQSYLWATRRARDSQQRRRLRQMGALLLSRRDRIYAELPPRFARPIDRVLRTRGR